MVSCLSCQACLVCKGKRNKTFYANRCDLRIDSLEVNTWQTLSHLKAILTSILTISTHKWLKNTTLARWNLTLKSRALIRHTVAPSVCSRENPAAMSALALSRHLQKLNIFAAGQLNLRFLWPRRLETRLFSLLPKTCMPVTEVSKHQAITKYQSQDSN